MSFTTQILYWFIGSIIVYIAYITYKAIIKKIQWQEAEDRCIDLRNEIIYIRAVRGRIRDMEDPFKKFVKWKLASWDVSNATNISDMFKGAPQITEIHAWTKYADDPDGDAEESTENKNSE
jgi:hypothetical protein